MAAAQDCGRTDNLPSGRGLSEVFARVHSRTRVTFAFFSFGASASTVPKDILAASRETEEVCVQHSLGTQPTCWRRLADTEFRLLLTAEAIRPNRCGRGAPRPTAPRSAPPRARPNIGPQDHTRPRACLRPPSDTGRRSR